MITTYMAIMQRLYKKGLLARRRDGKTDYYSPVHEREEYLALRARSDVDDLVAQYGDVALSHFAQQMAGLDPVRRRALQRLARKRLTHLPRGPRRGDGRLPSYYQV